MIKAQEARPSLKNWAFPPCNVQDEYDTLVYHNNQFKFIPYTPEIQKWGAVAVKQLAAKLPKTKVPDPFNVPNIQEVEFDPPFMLWFLESEFESNKSPGFPYTATSKTNGLLLQSRGNQVVQAMIERIKLLSKFVPNDSLTPKDLVRMGLIDPVRIFVKNEPTKQTKLDLKRQRFIASVSIVDNAISKALCSSQNKEEIELWDRIPCKPGMGLEDSDVEKLLREQEYLIKLFARVASDVAHWDFSVQDFDFQLDVDLRTLCNGGAGTVWSTILRNHFWCLARKVYMTSDGQMFEQVEPGIMPSGNYNTSSTNTHDRVLNNDMVAMMELQREIDTHCVANGDDATADDVIEDDAKEAAYARLGRKLKQSDKIDLSKGFEFCSTVMRRDESGLVKGYPVNVDKQLWNLLCNQSPNETRLFSFEVFKIGIRNHPDKEEILKLVLDSGFLN
jgi:hypothetical protein